MMNIEKMIQKDEKKRRDYWAAVEFGRIAELSSGVVDPQSVYRRLVGPDIQPAAPQRAPSYRGGIPRR